MDWHDEADYKLENLVADTEALLTPSTPVLVRMETLRRARYLREHGCAGREAAADQPHRARVDASESGGRPDALALLDAAYVAEAFREIVEPGGPEFAGRAPGVRAAIGNADGYALISRSIAAARTIPRFSSPRR